MADVAITETVTVGAAHPMLFILGPCVIEDESSTLRIAQELKEITSSLPVSFVFKASYDKANRTSIDSFRGPGIEEGLRILERVKLDFDLPVLTDVHCAHDVDAVASVADVLQVPAFLSRQTDLLVAAGRSGVAVNIKKGQFMAPADVAHSVKKVCSTGCSRVLLTERGVCFGYNNLVVDFRSIPVMRAGATPVIFDATHSVQRPSGRGATSGGDREEARYLARAAAAVGVDGFFMEVHPNPARALCDGPNSVALKELRAIIEELVAIEAASPKRAALK